MATRMIRRTMKTTKVTGLFVDLDTKSTVEETFTLTCPAKSESEIMKIVAKTRMFSDGSKKLVSVLSFEPETVRFAMSEADFIANATQIDG